MLFKDFQFPVPLVWQLFNAREQWQVAMGSCFSAGSDGSGESRGCKKAGQARGQTPAEVQMPIRRSWNG